MYTPEPLPGAEKKVPAGILAILLGSLGVHKFYLGYTQAGIITLLATLLTCGLAGAVLHVISIVEGVIYLTSTDAAFVSTYIRGRKEWL